MIEITQNTHSIIRSNKLVYDPSREHGKETCSNLYPVNEWEEINETDLDLDQVVGFKKINISEEARQLIYETYLNNRTGIIELSHLVYQKLSDELREIFSTNLILNNKVKFLFSNPVLVTSGQTTNGLHFDTDDGFDVRIGINLGDVPRRTYFVPKTKETFIREIGLDFKGDYDELYKEISLRNNSIYGILIKPSQGWLLDTKRILHDGRRAVKDGQSFVLLGSARKLI